MRPFAQITATAVAALVMAGSLPVGASPILGPGGHLPRVALEQPASDERVCVEYIVTRKCAKTITEVEETYRDPGPDPERELEFTLREKCVEWVEEKLCVRWAGDDAAMLPDTGR